MADIDFRDRSGRRIAASRYDLLLKIAAGGMATVYVGRQRGAAGFWRLVAIKRAHAHLLEDPQFRQMLIQEAQLASRIHHPNVVGVKDVEELDEELLLVMDYVEGVTLAALVQACQAEPLPARAAVRIVLDAAAGLHAAHSLRDDDDVPLGLIHRDVSPQNVLIGVDGAARLSDFGIAKCMQSRRDATTTGVLRGKLGYMAPEYILSQPLEARSDVFALGVVAWEALTGRRLFRGDNEVATMKLVTDQEAPAVSEAAPWVGTRLDDVVARALAKDPKERFDSAQHFATALDKAARRGDLIGPHSEVAAIVSELFAAELDERRARVRGCTGTGETTEDFPVSQSAVRTKQASATFPSDNSTLGASSLPRMEDPQGAATPRTSNRPLTAAVALVGVGLLSIGIAQLRAQDDPAATPSEQATERGSSVATTTQAPASSLARGLVEPPVQPADTAAPTPPEAPAASAVEKPPPESWRAAPAQTSAPKPSTAAPIPSTSAAPTTPAPIVTAPPNPYD